MNVWNRIYNGLFIFICVICIDYIMGTLVYLFGLIEKQPGILHGIYGAIVGGLIFIYFCELLMTNTLRVLELRVF